MREGKAGAISDWGWFRWPGLDCGKMPLGFALCLFTMLVVSCGRRPANGASEVVLYTSCDDYLLRDLKPLFKKETGITLLLVGDTEATKTTGLVQRVIAERDRPRADVWWSNEPLGTLKLAEEGLLAPSTPRALKEDFGGKWPRGLSSPDGLWWGFALRARAVVYNTARLKEADVPRSLGELADPKWKGRIGMARPQFGTTRAQMAWLLASCGEESFRAWLTALKANNVRLYDGNSAVVRAASQGEIDVGLTDTDDVVSGQREKWPVAMVLERAGEVKAGLCSPGPLCIANTVALVKGGPHSKEAAALIDFLLSEKVEKLLAESESRNLPIHEALAHTLQGKLPISPMEMPDLPMIHRAVPAAMKACTEILGE